MGFFDKPLFKLPRKSAEKRKGQKAKYKRRAKFKRNTRRVKENDRRHKEFSESMKFDFRTE